MSYLRTVIVSAVILLCLNSCATRNYIFNGVSGKVIDSYSKEPIPGAIVFIHWQTEGSGTVTTFPGEPLFVAETVSDTNGDFVFSGFDIKGLKKEIWLRNGTPYLGVFKDGYAFVVRNLSHDFEEIKYSKMKYFSSFKIGQAVELDKATVRDILKHQSNTVLNTLFSNLQSMARYEECYILNIPRGMRYLERFIHKANKSFHKIKSNMVSLNAYGMKTKFDHIVNRYDICNKRDGGIKN